MTKKPLLLTTKEAASILRVNRTKLYDLIKGGVIPGVRIGADWRIPIECIERLCAATIPDAFFQQRVPPRRKGGRPKLTEKKVRATIPVAST